MSKSEQATLKPLKGRKIVKGLTGGELTIECLVGRNIPFVFGLAGSEEVGLLDALVNRDDIEFITGLHENVVVAMADGYARSTGHTSFIQLHSVAGTAYALGQLINSFRDRLPLVVVAGRQSTDFRGHDGFLEAPNLHTLPRDYTQWIWDVMSAETIPEVMRRAFMFAEVPPGGPSFLTFSKDLWETVVDEAEIIAPERSVVEYDTEPPADYIRKIAERLLHSDYPVIYLGNELIRWNVAEKVAEIAELVGAAVMTGGKVPMVFPTTHPNYVGEFGDDPSLAKNIDVFWSVGGHMFKTISRPESAPLGSSTFIIHTGLNSTEVGRNYEVDLAAVAGIGATTSAVLERLKVLTSTTNNNISTRISNLHSYTSQRRAELDKIAEEEWDNVPIATSRLMKELNSVIGAEADIVSEVVSSDQFLRQYIDIDHEAPVDKRRRNFDTTGGVLGWAVAAAVGVKLGNPEREIWCLTGDGSFNFSSQSLWSVVHHNCAIPIVIFNNGQYQSNRRFQYKYAGKASKQGVYPGVSLANPDIDYVSMAAAYGIEAERVTDPADLGGALKRARQAAIEKKTPYLVDVQIERRFGGAEAQW